ncbi:hypothetical protein AAFF_G00095410 [Aldrovandia affinis]|uniref:Uncharacterized protein n=1 Tax=Aldrovandia affinis TaxID=143900 RepID=A0AAD7WCU9_9TELE|nr:hypothetical protein AAFF_G00095410 [Aldrovandia affinis]
MPSSAAALARNHLIPKQNISQPMLSHKGYRTCLPDDCSSSCPVDILLEACLPVVRPLGLPVSWARKRLLQPLLPWGQQRALCHTPPWGFSKLYYLCLYCTLPYPMEVTRGATHACLGRSRGHLSALSCG